MHSEKKLHIVAISGGFFIVFAAFWAFGLGNSFLDSLESRESTIQTISSDSNFENTLESSKVSEDSGISESSQITQDSFVPSYKIPKPISSRMSTAELVDSKINELEKSAFVFEGKGDIFQAVENKKNAVLNLVLKPLPGTMLKKFEITSGKLTIDNNGIPLDSGTVTFLDNNLVVLDILQNKSLDPVGKLEGNFEELPVDDTDKSIQVNFERQPLFLSNNDSIPYYLSVLGSIRLNGN